MLSTLPYPEALGLILPPNSEHPHSRTVRTYGRTTLAMQYCGQLLSDVQENPDSYKTWAAIQPQILNIFQTIPAFSSHSEEIYVDFLNDLIETLLGEAPEDIPADQLEGRMKSIQHAYFTILDLEHNFVAILE